VVAPSRRSPGPRPPPFLAVVGRNRGPGDGRKRRFDSSQYRLGREGRARTFRGGGSLEPDADRRSGGGPRRAGPAWSLDDSRSVPQRVIRPGRGDQPSRQRLAEGSRGIPRRGTSGSIRSRARPAFGWRHSRFGVGVREHQEDRHRGAGGTSKKRSQKPMRISISTAFPDVPTPGPGFLLRSFSTIRVKHLPSQSSRPRRLGLEGPSGRGITDRWTFEKAEIPGRARVGKSEARGRDDVLPLGITTPRRPGPWLPSDFPGRTAG